MSLRAVEEGSKVSDHGDDVDVGKEREVINIASVMVRDDVRR